MLITYAVLMLLLLPRHFSLLIFAICYYHILRLMLRFLLIRHDITPLLLLSLISHTLHCRCCRRHVLRARRLPCHATPLRRHATFDVTLY